MGFAEIRDLFYFAKNSKMPFPLTINMLLTNTKKDTSTDIPRYQYEDQRIYLEI